MIKLNSSLRHVNDITMLSSYHGQAVELYIYVFILFLLNPSFPLSFHIVRVLEMSSFPFANLKGEVKF